MYMMLCLVEYYYSFYIRLEKEYTVIRKEEQEEQIEIRVCTLDLLCCFLFGFFFSRKYEMKIVY